MRKLIGSQTAIRQFRPTWQIVTDKTQLRQKKLRKLIDSQTAIRQFRPTWQIVTDKTQ